MGSTGGPRNGVTPPDGVDAVRNALASVVPPGARVVLAVSGGRDSVGMACLVRDARPDLDAILVHVRHGLRDDAADAAAAQACAEALRLPARVVPVTVTADGTGPENAARTARMGALAAEAHEAGAAFVFSGHTAEDQAETVLLNVARGAGMGGLAGIPAVRELAPGVRLVRPVLSLRRADVRAAAAASGIPVVDDPTNDDPAQPRAVARSQLLPLLQRLTGQESDPVAALARLAGHARSEAAALDTIAAGLAGELLAEWAGVVAARADALADLPAAVGLRICREMVTRAGGQRLSEAAGTALLTLDAGQALSLAAGLAASSGGGWLAVAPAGRALPRRTVRAGALPIPEIAQVLVADHSDTSGILPPWAPPRAAAGVAVAGLDGLVVRAREPGDRIATAAGTQLLSDAMIDAGVPRLARDRTPVVADDDGPLWVPGVAVGTRAAGPWRLRFEPAAGSPTWPQGRRDQEVV